MVNHRCLECVLAFTVAALWTTSAHAEWQLGLGLATGIDTGELVLDSGGLAAGVSGRLGYNVDLLAGNVVPEFEAGYLRFPGDDEGNAPQAITTARLGLRLEVGIPFLSPAVYGHFGHASLEGEGTDYLVQRSGWSYDVGGALDLTIFPEVRIGVHGTWNALLGEDGQESLSWTEAGAHVAFAL